MLKRFCVCHHHHHRHDHHDHCQHYHRHHWQWWPAPVLTVFSSFTTTQHKLLPSPTTFLNSTKLAQTPPAQAIAESQFTRCTVQYISSSSYYHYYYYLLQFLFQAIIQIQLYSDYNVNAKLRMESNAPRYV